MTYVSGEAIEMHVGITCCTPWMLLEALSLILREYYF